MPEDDDGEPLGDLRDEIDARVAGEEDDETDDTLDELAEEVFEEMDVDAVDTEDLWSDLLADEETDVGIFDAEVEDEYQIVDKRLCHRCEFFGDPPTLHCTHEGTTIHEVVDMDHYRVTACPMVNSTTDPDRNGY